VTLGFGAIVLTQGRRPDRLRAAVESLLAQRDVELEVVVVGNDWEPEGVPDSVRTLALAENLGIPGGRNAGVGAVGGDVLLFIDDDASFPAPDTLAQMARAFEADPSLALIQPRVEPSDGGAPPRQWVPRVRVGDRARSGDVAVFFEAAVAVRRRAFEAVGGWPADFRFMHEGIDLAWRLLDAGYRLHYAGDLVALHPAIKAALPHYAVYYGARNRVWLARRHLPAPLGAAYVASWILRTLPRLRTRGARADALRGYRDGLRTDPGTRRPLHGRTLWRMLRLGRPPVL
jgi:GT2 family glycosyltransferase